jgi:hypothetical protein
MPGRIGSLCGYPDGGGRRSRFVPTIVAGAVRARAGGNEAPPPPKHDRPISTAPTSRGFAAPSLDAGQTRAIARNLVQRVNVEIMLNSKLRRESDFVGAIGL